MRSLFFVLLLTVAVWAQDEGSLGVELEAGPLVVSGSDVLRAGDQLVSIDGVDLRRMPFPQALALLRRPAGSHATVAVLRGPRRETVEVTWRPFPAPALAARVERVRQRKTAVTGVVERRDGQALTILLEDPVARAFAPGALVALMPDETVVGEARVTRIVSLYRLEAQLKPGSETRPWERVVVTP